MTIKSSHQNLPKHEKSVNQHDEFTAYYDLLDRAIDLKFAASPALARLRFICRSARQLTLQVPPNHHAAKTLLDCIPSAVSVEAIIALINNRFRRLND